jgi:hypothetical protein
MVPDDARCLHSLSRTITDHHGLTVRDDPSKDLVPGPLISIHIKLVFMLMNTKNHRDTCTKIRIWIELWKRNECLQVHFKTEILSTSSIALNPSTDFLHFTAFILGFFESCEFSHYFEFPNFSTWTSWKRHNFFEMCIWCNKIGMFT